ncbi:MAG TPA: hypothetical protein VHO29_11515 [Marmoricola sp.]|nr:hypothetical protein [Marmoricola sp.]
MVVRVPRALLVLASGLTLGLVAVVTLSRPTGPVAVVDPSSVHQTAGRDAALAVLHDWDVRRAAAWAAGDPVALRRLYTSGSAAGDSDVALLRRYVARGLVVRDLSMQVLRARVLVRRPRRLELEVTDRLAAAVAGRSGDVRSVRRLPESTVSTHLVVLRRPVRVWLVARVSAVPDR